MDKTVEAIKVLRLRGLSVPVFPPFVESRES
jgi:hypothetical protein